MRPQRETRRHTVSSYGIICYRMKIDFNERSLYPEYLLVQRKDSMAFVEFVRGKYVPDNIQYVHQLIANMTCDEKEVLAREPFEALWRRIWGRRIPTSARCGAEMVASKRAFDALKLMWGGDLSGLVASVPDCLSEREFGFPKGRKCGSEADIDCAIREFHEETGLDPTCVHIYNMKPQEEVFDGGNGILYRHVYFLARIVDMRGEPSKLPQEGTVQAQEVSSVRWSSFAEMCEKFEGSVTRLNVAKRANADIFRVLDPDPRTVTFNALTEATTYAPPPTSPPGLSITCKPTLIPAEGRVSTNDMPDSLD